MSAGNFIKFPRTPAARAFYAEVVRRMLASAMDGVPTVTDQMALTDCAKERLMPLTVLDDCQCQYQSGFYFQDPFYQGLCRLSSSTTGWWARRPRSSAFPPAAVPPAGSVVRYGTGIKETERKVSLENL